MIKTVLLILFNHNYEKNIDRLEKIYKERFTNIFYIMPFYTGNRKDVIAVFENSYYFQRYISTALEKIDLECEHYLIISDDLLLNPIINEFNYQHYFQVNEDCAFLPYPFLLSDENETKPYRPFAPYWPYIREAVDFTINQKGIEVKTFMPTVGEAERALRDRGFNYQSKIKKSLFFKKLPKKIPTRVDDFKGIYWSFRNIVRNLKYLLRENKLNYPLIGSYSDILIIPQKGVNTVIKLFGIFASLKLFAELAIPTSLALSSRQIKTEKDIDYKGLTMWNKQEFEDFNKKYQNSLQELMGNFPKDTLYVHPIKFSQWK